MENMHQIALPLLTKMSIQDSKQWCNYVDKVQQLINDTLARNTGETPFRILTGLHMINQLLQKLRNFLEQEVIEKNDVSDEPKCDQISQKFSTKIMLSKKKNGKNI